MSRNLLIVLIAPYFCMFLGHAGYAGDVNPDRDWDYQRQELVKELTGKGITDSLVLNAIGEIPRHSFVPEVWRARSYIDKPLPIGMGQTISQPFIVAYMCQELRLLPTDKVLEIGTGSGYHAAVLSRLCKKVFTIEIIPELGLNAEVVLASLGFDNVEVRIGDGYQGWVEEEPFDAIILTAAPGEIPQPLKDQLKVGGRLIAPVGRDWQELILLKKTENGWETEVLIPVIFVPMTGKAAKER